MLDIDKGIAFAKYKYSFRRFVSLSSYPGANECLSNSTLSRIVFRIAGIKWNRKDRLEKKVYFTQEKL